MARYLGPKHKLCRRVGERMCTSDKCPVVKRNYPPGVHGPKGRGKLTGYGLQLREKQKARWLYGILERQFRRYYEEAIRQRGANDVVLLQLLETRLDNVVYRLGMAKTRAGARQLVNHGHILVDGKKVDIPSCQVREGQVVSVDPAARAKVYWQNLAKVWGKQPLASDWLQIDTEEIKGQLVTRPLPEQIKPPFDTKLIIEFYSR
ncbi:MAG: 30S ribosomal protein S4 [Candidatus Veblenbacteria bacterium]|nr:30S ribosomal protein S4 [Candidatus Veblenbacteria bacterium]MDZ4229780.1 30S ribosomal protein S4 [Candidatus Veblenbacteria bacterium]